MNCFQHQTKKTGTRLLLTLGIGLMGVTHANLAQSSDLIAFGKACLERETRLNDAKNRLDVLSFGVQQAQIQANQSKESINAYLAEKATLDTAMTECAATTPNSADCHRVRHRYNVLSQLIEDAKINAIPDDSVWDDPSTDYEITRNNYQQEYEAFVALCRNSDAHYALIQSPTAYAAVCSTSEEKASLTCALF